MNNAGPYVELYPGDQLILQGVTRIKYLTDGVLLREMMQVSKSACVSLSSLSDQRPVQTTKALSAH